MISVFHLQRIKLPKMFLFDSLQLFAQFLVTTVRIATVSFISDCLETHRSVNLNVQLKIPSSRHQFRLVLQINILNMSIPAVQIPVDLEEMGQSNKYQYVFLTEMGAVELFANLIEEIYLPKEQTKIVFKNQTGDNGKKQYQTNSLHSNSSMIEDYNVVNSGSELNQILKSEKQSGIDRSLRKHYSSRRKINGKASKMSLSRSEYMKLEIDESLLESESGKATQSELKTKDQLLN